MNQNGYVLFSVQKKNETSGEHFHSIAKDRSNESKNVSIFHMCSFSDNLIQ